MSMAKREWQAAEEKSYVDAMAIIKSMKDREAAERRQMKGTGLLKVVEKLMWGSLMLAMLFVGAKIGEVYAKKDIDQAYKQGWKDALYKRPVSEELDMVCAGLWVGQENAKYIQKEADKKWQKN